MGECDNLGIWGQIWEFCSKNRPPKDGADGQVALGLLGNGDARATL